MVGLIAIGGGTLFVVALVGRGPSWLISTSRTALAILSCLVSALSLYLLCIGGLAFHVASADQLAETSFYKRTLDQFTLLEAAQGRYDELREKFLKSRDVKLVEARSAKEFGEDEARERITELLGAMRKATDVAMKRRIMATICLFRDRIRKDSSAARDLPRLATEAGVPQFGSYDETLEWIAGNLNKDGWEPLPLFRLSRGN